MDDAKRKKESWKSRLQQLSVEGQWLLRECLLTKGAVFMMVLEDNKNNAAESKKLVGERERERGEGERERGRGRGSDREREGGRGGEREGERGRGSDRDREREGGGEREGGVCEGSHLSLFRRCFRLHTTRRRRCRQLAVGLLRE